MDMEIFCATCVVRPVNLCCAAARSLACARTEGWDGAPEQRAIKLAARQRPKGCAQVGFGDAAGVVGKVDRGDFRAGDGEPYEGDSAWRLPGRMTAGGSKWHQCAAAVDLGDSSEEERRTALRPPPAGPRCCRHRDSAASGQSVGLSRSATARTALTDRRRHRSLGSYILPGDLSRARTRRRALGCQRSGPRQCGRLHGRRLAARSSVGTADCRRKLEDEPVAKRLAIRAGLTTAASPGAGRSVPAARDRAITRQPIG